MPEPLLVPENVAALVPVSRMLTAAHTVERVVPDGWACWPNRAPKRGGGPAL